MPAAPPPSGTPSLHSAIEGPRVLRIVWLLLFLLVPGCGPLGERVSYTDDSGDSGDSGAVCVPDCDDRECGPDGCGGTCDPGCLGGATCDDGFCLCDPGPPCGGDCPDGETCDEVLDTCVACVPDCDGRVCGSDGCGGECDPGCEAGEPCDETLGQCGHSAFGQAWWRFETASGLTVTDAGPHGLDGQRTRDTRWSGETPVSSLPLSDDENTGSLDLGWVDASTGGYFTVDEHDLLLSMGYDDFTFEAWVRLDSLSDTSDADQRQVLLQKKRERDSDEILDYMLLVQRGALDLSPNYGKTSGHTGRELQLAFGSGETMWGVTSHLEVEDTDWHFVSVAVDSAAQEVRFGVDDTFETVPFEDHGRVVNDGPLRVGAHQGSAGTDNHFLRGTVDELRLSQRFLAEDELLSATMPDCDGNGVWDALDLADGTHSDCNANARPDACDLDAGTSDDCQGDGIPDECQLTRTVALAHHQTGGSLAWRTDATYMAWLSRFDVEDGAGVLDAFEVDVGVLPAGTTIEPVVWSDPDGDGNPRDAQVLWSDTRVMPEDERTLAIDVPELEVGSTGTTFFVGLVLPDAVSGDDFPAQFDIAGSPPRGRSWAVGAQVPIDPDDLSRDAVEFAPLEDVLFAGSWVITATTIDAANDCNANGLPDDCEVSAEEVDDLDCNGGPDACEDCDGDGVLDAVTLAEGLDSDENLDGVPDACQLVGNDCDGDGVPDDAWLDDTTDCNGNGTLDSCDLANGTSEDANGTSVPDECEDCNRNGTVDSRDLAAGTSEDCDGDGRPDECQVGEPLSPLSYAYDDGSRESQMSFGGAVLEVAWMHRHTVEAGGEWISAIELVWGETYPGLPAKVVLWSDPDQDGNPTDARVLAVAETRTDHVDELVWNRVAIPPTYVGSEGTSFFVGAWFDDLYATQALALDVDDPADQGWMALDYSGGEMDLDDLAPGTPDTTLFLFPGLNFLLRAVGSDGRMTHDADGDGRLDACDGG